MNDKTKDMSYEEQLKWAESSPMTWGKFWWLFRNKRWDRVTMLIMQIVMAAIIAGFALTVPLAAQQGVSDAIKEALEPMSATILEIKTTVDGIQADHFNDDMDSAIVAYNKIKTTDDLEPLTQNGLAIKNGLKDARIYDALFAIDAARTREFFQYFYGAE